jgi:hypothetical protein
VGAYEAWERAKVAAMSGQKEYGERPRLDVTVTVLK